MKIRIIILLSLIIIGGIDTLIANNWAFNRFQNDIITQSTFKEKDSLSFENSYNNSYKNYKERNYPEALKTALILFSNSKKNNNSFYCFKSAELIGEIYNKTTNTELSLKYFKIALANLNFKKLESQTTQNHQSTDQHLAKLYLKIGTAYLKTYREAKFKKNRDEDYLKLLEEGNINDYVNKDNLSKDFKKYKDSILFFFAKLDSLPSLNEEILNYKASSKLNLSALYQIDSLYSKSKFFALKAIEIYKKKNDKIRLAKAQSNLGNIYIQTSEFNKAKKTYWEGVEAIKNDNSQEATKLKANLYYNLAWAMRNLKDYKAYDYQEISFEIKDIQREKNINQIVQEIEANHKENLQKQKVNLVKEQRKLEEVQEAKTSMLFGALSFLVLIVSGVIIYNYKLRQKNLRLKLSESKLIQQQNLEKVRSEAQVKILNATIDGKETERKLIAEILHDNVSALLSSANMHLTATKKQFNGDMPQEIEKTQAIISEASQKVRDLSHNLVSSILLKFGLEYAIKDVVKKYSNSQLKLEVSAKNINRYNQEFEIKIFNVIQELINNILKHSKAKHAQIDLKEERNQLTVLVKDDGVGFSTSSSSFSDGIGLNQVEARIHMMDGKLTIKSVVNVGTSILIKVPILKKEKNLSKLTSVS
ncbi:ATP-binding protein [Tenacibaculum ascidiaceicola]|uniref:sensor histidine kinase n=1 Tax=Tenacibaculum ascidiaceicola TaxID=1699411 RepID=UPI0039E7B51D